PPGDRREPALRRRLPAAAGRGQPVSGARARARARRASRAAPRRVPRGRRDDALLLRPLPRRERERRARAVRGGAPAPGRGRAGRDGLRCEGALAVRYLVTGAAGFVGSHLAERLVAAGHDVLGVDSFTDYYDPERKRENARDLDVLEADLVSADLEALLDGVDGVFHLAGQPGVRASFGPGFEAYVERNVRASGRVFETAARRRVRVVYASSSSVYGDAESYPTREDARPRPISPYGVTKLCVEHLAYA